MYITNFKVLIVLCFFAGPCACSKPVLIEGARGEERGKSVKSRDFKHVELLLSWNLQPLVLGNDIRPRWIDDNRFWYSVRTKEGIRFYKVNPVEPDKIVAFDHEKLAQALEDLLDKKIKPGNLPFTDFDFINEESAIRFAIDDITITCDLTDYECSELNAVKQPPDSVLSPDKKWSAYIRDYNLRVRNLDTGEDFALTETGTERYGFATNSQGWYRSATPVLHWSPDSRKIATYQLDERNVKEMHLLETAIGRPVLESWPYALPGDSLVPMLERVVLDIESRRIIRLDIEPSHQRTSNCCGLERGNYWADIQWSENAEQLAFVTTSRDYREVNLYLSDTETGDVRHIYRETANTFFESNLVSLGIPNWRILFEREQFIWFTRKDEWGHLYLHNLNDGHQLFQITEGEWNVVDLHHIDESQEKIWFTAVGVNNDQDPYLKQFYSIGLNYSDDKLSKPKLLTPEVADHEINMSPSGNFFTDEYSTFQQPTETIIRNANGEMVMYLEKADISKLRETSWTAPEPFTVKARDDETDLFGILIRPSEFDPSIKWPVIISIYPGPQTGSVGTRSFSVSRRGQAHALAELGFIVVMIDALGTPLRSKSFHTAWYGNMIDNGIEDQIAGLEQLSQRYDWIDSDRVGIFGHSGGGYATVSALLRFPGVFRAGAAGAGNLDNRGYTYYWGEKYQGQLYDDDGSDAYARQSVFNLASRLEDRLLLSFGTMDSNVHPNMTLQLINELIKANKVFDLIVMPNKGHGYANELYYIRRVWDFFVLHLLETSMADKSDTQAHE